MTSITTKLFPRPILGLVLVVWIIVASLWLPNAVGLFLPRQLLHSSLQPNIVPFEKTPPSLFRRIIGGNSNCKSSSRSRTMTGTRLPTHTWSGRAMSDAGDAPDLTEWLPSSSFSSLTTTTTTTIPSDVPPSSSSVRPILGGVVFDMDGTLTVPNIDFAAMYRECGVPLDGDVLAMVSSYHPDERQRCEQIIERIEEDGRISMQLMDGTIQILIWLKRHNIPVALVTRNTHKTIQVFIETLVQEAMTMTTLNPDDWECLLRVPTNGGSNDENSSSIFTHLISRDDPYPPKPDPSALYEIVKDWMVHDGDDNGNGNGGDGTRRSNCTTGTASSLSQSLSSRVVMVGDSLSNDVMFGKNAGVDTALLRPDDGRRSNGVMADATAADAVSSSLNDHPIVRTDGRHGSNNNNNNNDNIKDEDRRRDHVEPDMTISHLTQLPYLLWQRYHVGRTAEGPFGTDPFQWDG